RDAWRAHRRRTATPATCERRPRPSSCFQGVSSFRYGAFHRENRRSPIESSANRVSRTMSWATYAKEASRRGETVQIRPRGHSMSGKVNDGDRVTLAPADPATLKVADIVLVRVHGTDYLHLIKAISRGRFLIGNNRGGINGWVGSHTIYGIATKIEA